MADNNSNAAYDLSRFAPAQSNPAPGRQHEHLPVKPDELKEIVRTRRESRDAKKLRRQRLVKFVSVSLTLLMLACLKLSANVEISKLDKELKQETALLNTAQSESIRLITEMENRYSFEQVQAYSKEKNMQRIQDDQRFNVNMLKQDKVTNYLGQPIN